MIRVHVSESLMALGTSVHVVDNFENGAGHVILRLDGNATRWEPFDPNDVTEAPEPTFRLPLDVGRAVLDALVRHYNGAEDTRSLRRDYDAERKRVDEQAKLIADVARTLASKVGQS